MSEEICSINSVPHHVMAIQLWEKYIENCNAENFEAANFILEQMKLLNLNKHGRNIILLSVRQLQRVASGLNVTPGLSTLANENYLRDKCKELKDHEKQKLEKGENEEFQSNNESNRDKESEADKNREEKFTDLHVEMLNDEALRPASLTDLMIGHINRKKPYYIGIIETLKSVYKDRDQMYYWVVRKVPGLENMVGVALYPIQAEKAFGE
ncbi:hypothetical protein TNCV_4208601 [Trichonephila clavipes]|nr:hypothetical protein TNCV_4208601 [Trichonephila clavipes]